MSTKETPIYHLTHIGNLPSILAAGGLWCDAERLSRNISVRNIAYADIKERRRKKQVHLASGGVLADYVPFYFANRSPMLSAIHGGFVPNCTAKQDELIYLVSSVEEVVVQECFWCFTDGHAIEKITRFFDSTSDLNQLDWGVLNSREWRNTTEHPDRKRKKQAEFLVHRFFSWEWVTHLGVKSPEMRQHVAEILASAGQERRIWQQPRWYFIDHD